MQPMMKFSQSILGANRFAFKTKFLRKKNFKTDFELFFISHKFLVFEKSVLKIFILLCKNIKSEPISYY